MYEDLESGTPSIVGDEGHGDGEFSPAPAAPATAPKPTAKQEPEPEPKQSPKDLAAMRARITELETSERYWAEQAKKAGTAPPPSAPKSDGPDELEQLLADAGIEDDTAAALLDDIGEKGVAALQKRGVITKAQLKPILAAIEKRMEAKAIQLAESRVEGAKGQLTAEAKLMQDYPELQDQKSEFSKAVAVEFAAMVAEDPSLQNSYTALRQAAKIAKLTLKQPDTRAQRIKSQAPSRGAAPASEFDDDEVDISPEAQMLISAGRRYGLDETTYRRHATAHRRGA
ncbi:MAG: hypothetical protein ACR2J8_13360 [Thermomicrobiales bacterium]